jgi:Arc/MetJ family transcription regulator
LIAPRPAASLFEGLRAEGLSRIAGGRNGAHPVVYPDRVAEDILTPKVVEMAKTLIDVDEETLAAAQEVLGAGTKKDTVNAALRAVVALAARRRDLQRLVAGGLPDLEDAEVMAAAWQR